MINQTETRDHGLAFGLDEEKVNQVQNNCLKANTSIYIYAVHYAMPFQNVALY